MIIRLYKVRPRSHTLVAWQIPRGQSYPARYFTARRNQQMGLLACFQHHGLLKAWTIPYCIGSWLVFTHEPDGRWFADNVPERTFEDLFEVTESYLEPTDSDTGVPAQSQRQRSRPVIDDNQVADDSKRGSDKG